MTHATQEGFIRETTRAWESVGEGVRRKILGHDPQLMMVRVNFAKGSIGPVHTHPHRQVTFIAYGSLEVRIGREKQVLRSGDCYFIPPGVEHGVVALEESSLIDVFTPAREDFIIANG